MPTYANNPTAETPGINAGLLILRIGVGLSVLLLFGLTKLHDAWGYLHTGDWRFVDFNRKVGLPLPVVVAFIQTLNESVCAFLVACGLFTRYAAALTGIGFTAAAICSLKMGEPAWLTAAYFALMFVTLMLTGAGKFSLDHWLESRRSSQSLQPSPEESRDARP